MTEKARLVKEYLEKYPDHSKRSIAKLLSIEYPYVFLTSESARDAIRYYTDAHGDNNRKLNKPFMIERNTHFSNLNPYGIPESDAKPFEIYKLPTGNKNVLFLSDIHLPYHDIHALTLAFEYGLKHNIDTIWLNGDILDCYMASNHEKDPYKRDLAHELEIGRQFIQTLKKTFPKAKIFWKEGNHEMRWKRFLRLKAPELLGINEFQLPIILRLAESGVEWIANNQLVQFGKLNVIHGNEYKGGGGINVARTLWLRAGDNVIAGDKHKTQTGLKTNIDKKTVGSWSVGCLCELNPDYLTFNEWNLGFAHIEIFKDETFIVHNKQIINGRIL